MAVQTRLTNIAFDVALRLKVLMLSVPVACLLASTASAQAAATMPQHASPLGVWRGTSVCLVRPSSCNDEIVVYRITPLSARDTVSMDALKIVRGEEEDMGVLRCHVTTASSADAALTCPMPNGVWRFTVRRDSLVGELRLLDSTKFRDVHTSRSR